MKKRRIKYDYVVDGFIDNLVVFYGLDINVRNMNFVFFFWF